MIKVAPVLLLSTVLLLLSFGLSEKSSALDNNLDFGLKAGFGKLEGDWKKPKFNPCGALSVSYRVFPYLAFGSEFGYSVMKTKTDAIRIDPSYTDTDLFQIRTIPIEAYCRFNFLPYKEICPFSTLGVGVFSWEALYDKETIKIPPEGGERQKKIHPVIKVGGGLEYVSGSGVGVAAGIDFHYTLTDYLDQIDNGDENDGIISAWAGVVYRPRSRDFSDIDGDRIPQELDLDPVYAEDRNGFMDHDGKPEQGVPSNFDQKVPLVIHFPVFQAEANRDIVIRAQIASTVPLRTAAVLYRSKGSKTWKVVQLEQKLDDSFEGTIYGEFVTQQGLEYCVVAVDEEVKGIGYSGLPSRPIYVNVVRNGMVWRIAGGIATALSWTAATYLIIRKQIF
jgi:hypothetical protein